MKNTGAIYCVYEDSGFLTESVHRIYPLMDRIVFLINFMPWFGNPNPEAITKTIHTIEAMPDPNRKITVVSRYWPNETDQRNYGTWLLRQMGMEWHLVIDDDELYVTKELEHALDIVNLDDQACYLVNHQIYWKNRNTIIDMNPFSVPTIINTQENLVLFNLNRTVIVYKGKTWTSLPSEVLICHHMSYVRTDEQMLRKIQNFSHADEMISTWYNEKWLKWTENMTDLHPKVASEFKKTIPAENSRYKLDMSIV